jgi:hypothetical protein
MASLWVTNLALDFSERGQQRGPDDTVQISAMDIIGDRFEPETQQSRGLDYDPSLTQVPEAAHLDVDSALRYGQWWADQTHLSSCTGSFDRAFTLKCCIRWGSRIRSGSSRIYPTTRLLVWIILLRVGWHGCGVTLLCDVRPALLRLIQHTSLFSTSHGLCRKGSRIQTHLQCRLPEALYHLSGERVHQLTHLDTYKASAREVVEQDGMYVTYTDLSRRLRTQGRRVRLTWVSTPGDDPQDKRGAASY